MLSLLSIFVILIYPSTVFSKDDPEICPFKDTVDLAGYTPLEDGSYLYQSILIPENKLASYNYRLDFNNERIPAELHIRGCVCGSPNYCIKVCCEWGEFFNESSYKCERIPDNLNVVTDLNVISENGINKTVNIFEYFIYQVGVPCKHPETLTMDDDKWQLMANGLLYIDNDESYQDTLSYCLTPFRYEGTDKNVLVPMSCPMKNEMSSSLAFHSYAPVVAVLFLIPTVMVYLWLKELRENMRGKLLICYLISLIVSYSTISYINISEQIFDENMCCILGFTCYFFFMAAFLWLSVLCFDIWINFKNHSVANNPKKNRIRFIYYTVYAWGAASLLTGLVMWCQWSKHVSEAYKPGIGEDVCWLDTSKWSAAIYFYWPNMIILIFSIVTFAHLTLRVYRVRRDVAKMSQKDTTFFQENAVVILRIFIILGISWILDILSYFLRDFEAWDFLSILSDLRNGIQGILIFVLFVLKRNVFNSIKKSLCSSKKTVIREGSAKFARLSKSSASNVPQTEVEFVVVN